MVCPKSGAAKVLTILATLCIAATAAGEGELRPFVAEYHLTGGGIRIATVRMTLRRGPNNTYVYRSATEPSGLVALFRSDRIVETSIWRLTGENIVAMEYRYRRSGSEERRVSVSFDHEASRVTTLTNGQPWSMDVPPGTLDKLLANLAFMLDLRQGKGGLRYPVADGGHLKEYQYTREGEERLETALGPLETVRYRRAKVGKRPKTKLWCAPELGWFPVRVERRDDGAAYQMSLVALETDDTAPTQDATATPSPLVRDGDD